MTFHLSRCHAGYSWPCLGQVRRSRSLVKVQGHRLTWWNNINSAGLCSLHSECVHSWRPLANEIKLWWKCALTKCCAEMVGATSSESFYSGWWCWRRLMFWRAARRAIWTTTNCCSSWLAESVYRARCQTQQISRGCPTRAGTRYVACPLYPASKDLRTYILTWIKELAIKTSWESTLSRD